MISMTNITTGIQNLNKRDQIYYNPHAVIPCQLKEIVD